MAEIVNNFFTVTGIDLVPPSTIAELIPYLLSVLLSVVLVCGVFRIIGKLTDLILNYTRFR